MARKKRVSFGERLRHALSDVTNAASVAATGSEIGVLELAAEDEFRSPEVKRPRKSKAAPKKKTARKKKKAVTARARKPKKKRRTAKRR